MEYQTLLSQIRELIILDDLPMALKMMRSLLQNTPKLNEILHHSGRLEKIRRESRLGLVSDSDANLEQNRIRFGVLDLLLEIEQQGLHSAALGEVLEAVEQESARPELKGELERAVSIVHSKNVVVGSTINAQTISIGDKTETHYHHGEEKRTQSVWLKIGAVLVTVIGLLAGIAEFTGISLKDILKADSLDTQTPNSVKTETAPVESMPQSPESQSKGKNNTTSHRNHFESRDSSTQINLPDNQGTINLNQ